ncbi:MAG: hypothetical protein AABX71_03395 [Nanoarchaeota archaeon]
MKKCVYCKAEIEDESVVDVCGNCGVGVWGERMFKAIIENMENAREKGDLNQGLINLGLNKDPKTKI